MVSAQICIYVVVFDDIFCDEMHRELAGVDVAENNDSASDWVCADYLDGDLH